MLCPKCKKERFEVYMVPSKFPDALEYNQRRRKCPVCGFKDDTFEVTRNQLRDGFLIECILGQ